METTIATSAIIHPGVILSEGCTVHDFVILGVGIQSADGNSQTTIGKNAVIRSHTVIYFGNIIGDQFATGHFVLIREHNVIGDSVSIGSHSVIEHHLAIGDRTRIHSNVFIPEYSRIEHDVWIGPNVVFTNATYPANPQTKDHLKGPHVLPFARIGANATLLPGVEIGRNTLVGAGSVVTRNVPDGKVVTGNPARIIKDITDIPDYDFVKYLKEE